MIRYYLKRLQGSECLISDKSIWMNYYLQLVTKVLLSLQLVSSCNTRRSRHATGHNTHGRRHIWTHQDTTLSRSIVVAIDRLKLYTGENPIEPDPAADLQMTGDEFAEELDPAEFEWNNDHSVDLETYKHLMPVLTGPSPYPDDTLDDGDHAINDSDPPHSDNQPKISPTTTSPTQPQVQCPNKTLMPSPKHQVPTSVTYPIVSVQLFPPIISNLKYKPRLPPTSSRKK